MRFMSGLYLLNSYYLHMIELLLVVRINRSTYITVVEGKKTLQLSWKFSRQ